MLDIVTQKRWAEKPVPVEPESLEDQLSASQWVEAAELAYHHGEIAHAVSELPAAQQRYVRARFWGGMKWTELANLFGYDPSSLWTSRENGARGKLRDKLAHLESATC